MGYRRLPTAQASEPGRSDTGISVHRDRAGGADTVAPRSFDELSTVNALHRLRAIQGIVRLRDTYGDPRGGTFAHSAPVSATTIKPFLQRSGDQPKRLCTTVIRFRPIPAQFVPDPYPNSWVELQTATRGSLCNVLVHRPQDESVKGVHRVLREA